MNDQDYAELYQEDDEYDFCDWCGGVFCEGCGGCDCEDFACNCW